MLEQSFAASDNVVGLTLTDIKSMLEAETAVPDGYFTAAVSDKLVVYLLDVDDIVPRLAACITVDSALNLVVSLNQSLISPVHYEDIVSGSPVQLSQLVNLMARMKSWTTDVESWTLSGTVDMAVNVLKVGLSNL